VEEALEAAYEADRGFAVPTIIFTPAELRQITADADDLGHAGRHYVSLLKDSPTAAATKIIEDSGGDGARAVVMDRAVHLLVDGDYLSSPITNAEVEKLLGVATNRNLTVISALAEKWC